MPIRKSERSLEVLDAEGGSVDTLKLFSPDGRLENLLQRAWFVEHQKLLR